MSDRDDDTLPPDAPPGDPISRLFELAEIFTDTVSELKKPDDTGRPAEVWVRWKKLEGGIAITACTEKQLGESLLEGEHEGRFR